MSEFRVTAEGSVLPLLRNSSHVNLPRPPGLSPAFGAVVEMAEAWLRLVLDELMSAKTAGPPAIPDIRNLLNWAGVTSPDSTSELATGYQHRIADMTEYTRYLNRRDTDVRRQIAGMERSVHDTLLAIWVGIDAVTDALAVVRGPFLLPWIEAMLVARVVEILTDVQDELT
ncbi:hypothetical protein [Nocardia altamirensis]|uniref:hypothetical protein n=1 Tax=Nocardia altamirensis TaxID=472158 RepID=UPI00084064F1|nr:hypothetical protein [Nocardia altamirensis]